MSIEHKLAIATLIVALRFLVLTKSNVNIKEIQKQIGCGKPHICSGQWKGEMWTIERLSKSQ